MARWMLKTAIMYEYRESQRKGGSLRYFKPLDRTGLFVRGEFPANTYVFVGHYIGPDALWTTDADVPLNFSFSGSDFHFPAYSMTLSIAQLALQIFSFRHPVESGATAVNFNLPGLFPKATVQIWPVTGNKHWPPEVKFDDDGRREFANTWRKSLRPD